MTLRPALAIVGLLLAVYAGMALWCVHSCSPTADEPLHLTAAYVIKERGDFRVNPEDPPLFQRWVGLALRQRDLAPDYSSSDWEGMRTDLLKHSEWTIDAMYP